jgi:CheY-like chemotaxis protein/predicted regulator of Ras-like GTPase activity (Roadblock/LC7/MglB family)
LERAGYRAETAADGREALQRIAATDFDLVLTDLQMPDMDGMELLRAIKSRQPHPSVIMMTAFARTETVIEALRSGVNDFVTKPFVKEDLLEMVRRELARRAALQAPPAAAAPEQTAPAAAPAVIGGRLTAAQGDEIDRLLAELRAEISARCVLVVESTGHVIAAKGVFHDINLPALAALVAGDFAATRGMAALLGEEAAFRMTFHEGRQYSMYTAHLSDELFLVVAFGQEVKQGMVAYAVRQLIPHLEAVFASLAAAPASAAGDETFLFEDAAMIQQIMQDGFLEDNDFSGLDDQLAQLWGEG